jgi:hypothetical protein
MASTTGKSDSVRFDQPQDWIKWSREFRIKTKSLNLWTHIDPDNRIPWPVEPVAPVISNYPKRAVRIEARSSSSRTIDTNLSPAQEETDTHNAPRTTSEMTTEGRANYQLDVNSYMFLKKEFKDYRTNLDKLTDWITSTTGTSIRESCCDEDKTIDEWYLALKQTGSPYEEVQVVHLRTKYQAAIKPLTRMPRKFNEWLTEWESIMAEGQRIKYPEAINATFWARDLAKALQNILGSWSSTFLSINRTKIHTNDLHFRQVAAELHEHWSSLYQQPPSRIAKGSFPTFGQSNDTVPYDLENEPDADSSDQPMKKKQRSKKRKRVDTTDATSRTRCMACQARHPLRECYYAFPHLVPEGWTPRPAATRLVADRIKQDTSLAEEIKRLRKDKDNTSDS